MDDNFEQGYKYQILLYDKHKNAFEIIDYAVDQADKDFLIKEYRMDGLTYIFILQPKKYWK